MSDNGSGHQLRPQIGWPKWVGYAVTLVLEGLLTAGLLFLQRYFPLGNYPILYVLLIMAVAYLFGEGAAAVAFLAGLALFLHFFVPPAGSNWPPAETPEGWAGLTAFFIGTSIVGFVTLLMRRSGHDTRRLAGQLTEARDLAEYRQGELEAILSSTPNGVIVVGTDRRVVYFNPAVEKVVPVEREVGQPIDYWIKAANARDMHGAPIDVDDHPSVVALRGNFVAERSLLVNGESGPDTIVSVTAAPMRDARGRITGSVVIFRNVTAQQRLQQEVEQQRSLLDAFMQNVPVGLVFRGRDGRAAIANRALAEIHGVPLDMILGKRVGEYLPSGPASEIEKAIQQVYDTGQPVVWQDSVIFGGGRWQNVSFQPVRGADGEIVGVGTVVVETTGQVRTRKEIERQRSLLDTFTQHVPVGLVFQDRDGRCIIANRALAEINGVMIEDMLGKRAEEYLPAGLADRVNRAIRQVFETGEPVFWRDITTDLGGERWFNVSYQPVRTSDGEVIGVGTVVVETTEQVKARRALQRVYERERKIAEELQSSLLGEVPKRLNGFEFETAYRAALEEARVGGDFYDVFAITKDRTGIVVGDVSGKGLAAAAHVALAKYTIRSRAYENEAPSRIMEQVNETLVRELEADGFMTIFFGILDSQSMTLTYANCGQAPAFLWQAADAKVESLAATGPVAGSISGVKCRERTMRLHEGDELLLGTDGLFEIGVGRQMLGLDALADIFLDMKRSGVSSAAAVVERAVEAGRSKLRDDVAVLRVSVAKAPETEYVI